MNETITSPKQSRLSGCSLAWLLCILVPLALVTISELYQVFVPPYSDDAFRGSLVDTFGAHSLYYFFAFWFSVAVFACSLLVALFGSRHLRIIALAMVALSAVSSALVISNDLRLTERAARATGMQLVPLFHFY